MGSPNVASGVPGPKTAFPRGIAPRALLEAVYNTIPFLFDAMTDETVLKDAPHLQRLRAFYAALQAGQEPALSHLEYYLLCLSAHHATVSSLVPTDVDNQIRQKLWAPNLPLEVLLALKDAVMDSRGWECRFVSRRFVLHPQSGEVLSGHAGEWLSTIGACYGALCRALKARKVDAGGDSTALEGAVKEVATAILDEVNREAGIYAALKKARDGIGVLKASTIIAHNLGDLDRVLDLWEIPAKDALKSRVYKAGLEDPSRFGGVLVEAGALNKAHMAVENHRHFPLREPKCLRRRADMLVPLGPFLDEWGLCVGGHDALTVEEKAEVVVVLVEGHERLNKVPGGPMGYARALAGLLERFPGGMSVLEDLVSARIARTLKAGPLRMLIGVPRKRFEDQWAGYALGKRG